MERKRVKNGLWAVLLAVCIMTAVWPATVRGAMSNDEISSPVLRIYETEPDTEGNFEVKIFYHPKNTAAWASTQKIQLYFYYGEDRNYDFVSGGSNEILATENLAQALTLSQGLKTIKVPTINVTSHEGEIGIELNPTGRTNTKDTSVLTISCKKRESGNKGFVLTVPEGGSAAVTVSARIATFRASTADTGAKFLHIWYSSQDGENPADALKEYRDSYEAIARYMKEMDIQEFSDEDIAQAESKKAEFEAKAKSVEPAGSLQTIYDQLVAYYEAGRAFTEEQKKEMQNSYKDTLENYISAKYGREPETYGNSGDMHRAIEEGKENIDGCVTRPQIRDALAEAGSVLDYLAAKDGACREIQEYKVNEIPEEKKEFCESQRQKGLALVMKARVMKEVEDALSTAKVYVDLALEETCPEWVKGVYQIETKDDLLWLRGQCNGESTGKKISDLNVKLINDISLSGETGFQIEEFSGVFDGGGHTITDFESDKSLFEKITGTLRNLSVQGEVGVNTEPNRNIGGIVETNADRGRIENCVSSIRITATNENKRLAMGGIAGVNNGIIERCTNKGELEAGPSGAGGIVGENKGEISQCENSAAILYAGTRTMENGIAGIAAVCQSGVIRYCKNSGTIMGDFSGEESSDDLTLVAGGIAASGYGTLYGNCNEGQVTVDRDGWSAKYAGAIVGRETGSSGKKMELYGNYYNADVLSDVCLSGTGGRTEDEPDASVLFKNAAELTDEDIWKLNSGCGYTGAENIWTVADGKLVYAQDGAPVYKVMLSPELLGYVRLEKDSRVCEGGFAYVTGRQRFKVAAEKSGYTFSELTVNGENESDSVEGKSFYRLLCTGGYDVEIGAKLDGSQAVAECRTAIGAIGTVTNRNGKAVEAARRAYDGLFPEDQAGLAEAAKVLEEAEHVLEFLKRVKASLKETVYVSDGTEKKPEAEVYVRDSGNPETGKTLTAGTDYTVSYENNVRPGTATASIAFLGDYASAGRFLIDFTIRPAEQKQPEENKPGSDKTDGNPAEAPDSRKTDIGEASVSLDETYAHTGRALTPAVTVKLGDTVLDAGTDYTVSYRSNKEPGRAEVTVTGTGKYSGSVKAAFIIKAAKGKTYTVGGLKYKVTNADTQKGGVSVSGVEKKTQKSVSVPSKVRIGIYSYKVTAIGSRAFENCKSLKKAVVGANVKSIGAKAFYGDKKLTAITVKSKVLASVGKNALKGISAKASIKVPSGKVKTYKKVFKGKGQKNTVKIKK